jgi:hypothetical protein
MAVDIFSLRMCSKGLLRIAEEWKAHLVLTKQVTKQLKVLLEQKTEPFLDLIRAKGGVVSGQFLLTALSGSQLASPIDLYFDENTWGLFSAIEEVFARRISFSYYGSSDSVSNWGFVLREVREQITILLHFTSCIFAHANSALIFDGRKLEVDMDDW